MRGGFGNDAVRSSLLTAPLASMLGASRFVWTGASIRRDIAHAAPLAA